MKIATMAKILATGMALFILVFDVAATDPIFVKWLVIDDPGDETIRHYWQQAEAGELNAGELVDLGTMLFYRGWPNDAVAYFKEALELDPELSDAWFRTGLVKHHSGDLDGARSAYKKCLKKQSGHAWCNFYLGLLEEQTGEAKSAMKHYETAFKHAPELANPKTNPEILSSKLQLGAQVRHFDRERFEKTMPMPLLEPATYRQVHKQYAPEKPPKAPIAPESETGSAPPPPAEETVSQTGSTRSTAAGSSGGSRTTGASRSRSSRSPTNTQSGTGANESTPYGVPDAGGTPYGVPESALPESQPSDDPPATAPQIGETSPEASLRPIWPALYELAEALI